MIALPLTPFCILYLGNLKGLIPTFSFNPQVAIVLDFLAVSGVGVVVYYALRNYKTQKQKSIVVEALRQKLISFHQSLMGMYTFLVAGSGVSVVGYLLTTSNIHVVSFVGLLVLFSLKRPSLKMIVEELQITGRQSQILRNREVIDE